MAILTKTTAQLQSKLVKLKSGKWRLTTPDGTRSTGIFVAQFQALSRGAEQGYVRELESLWSAHDRELEGVFTGDTDALSGIWIWQLEVRRAELFSDMRLEVQTLVAEDNPLNPKYSLEQALAVIDEFVAQGPEGQRVMRDIGQAIKKHERQGAVALHTGSDSPHFEDVVAYLVAC